jgi:hypothetical protein
MPMNLFTLLLPFLKNDAIAQHAGSGIECIRSSAAWPVRFEAVLLNHGG